MDKNNDIEILNNEKNEEVGTLNIENKEPVNINPTLNNGPSNNFDKTILETNNKPNNAKIIISIIIAGVILIGILSFSGKISFLKPSIYGTYVRIDNPKTSFTFLKMVYAIIDLN